MVQAKPDIVTTHCGWAPSTDKVVLIKCGLLSNSNNRVPAS